MTHIPHCHSLSRTVGGSCLNRGPAFKNCTEMPTLRTLGKVPGTWKEWQPSFLPSTGFQGTLALINQSPCGVIKFCLRSRSTEREREIIYLLVYYTNDHGYRVWTESKSFFQVSHASVRAPKLGPSSTASKATNRAGWEMEHGLEPAPI